MDKNGLTRKTIFDILVKEFTIRELIKAIDDIYKLPTKEQARRKATIIAVNSTEYYFHNQNDFKNMLKFIKIENII